MAAVNTPYDLRNPPRDSSSFGRPVGVRSAFADPFEQTFELLDTNAELQGRSAVDGLGAAPPVAVVRRARARIIYLDDVLFHLPSGLVVQQEAGEWFVLQESTWQAKAQFFEDIRCDKSTSWTWRIGDVEPVPVDRSDFALCFHRQHYQYFHLLADMISKAALVLTQRLDVPMYVGPFDQISKVGQEALDWLVAPERRVSLPDVDWLRLRGVYYPVYQYSENVRLRPSYGNGVHNNGAWNPLFLDFCQSFARRIAGPQPPRRIFLDRADARWRRTTEPAPLRRLCEELGYVLVSPGELTFEQQVCAFRSATAVGAIHGAGLANLLWADAPAVVEFFPEGFVDPGYELICAERSAPYSRFSFDRAHVRDSVYFDDLQLDLDRVRQILTALAEHDTSDP